MKALQIALLAFTAIQLATPVPLSPSTSTSLSSQNSEKTTPKNEPTSLPGKGLAQHPFLYTGEWDTRKPVQTIFLVRGGKVVWTYSIPIKNEKGDLNEFDDIHLLSNGHVLFARKTGAGEVSPDKKLVWNYDAPKETEVHSAQPVGKDKVLFMQNGTPAKLILMNKRSGKVELEHVLPTARPDDPKSVHGQFRHVRMNQSWNLPGRAPEHGQGRRV